MWRMYAAVLATLLLVGGGTAYVTSSYHKLEIQNAEARGSRRGICSQMWWNVRTNSLKPGSEATTRRVYPDLCEKIGEPPL